MAYLTTVFGLASRRVVGLAVANPMPADLIYDALKVAFGSRPPMSGHVPL